MKICIFGAGAVGSHVAARLTAADAGEISVIGRGAHLKAIQERGITLRSTTGEEIRARPAATGDPSSLPPQDLLIVALKGTALPGVAATLEKLLAPDGWAVFLLNGIPWWWPQGLPGDRGPLKLLDPEGALWNRLRKRTLGCVVNSPNDVVEPGVVVHVGRHRFTLGEPDASSSERVNRTADVFRRGGMEAPISADLRREIWNKLLLNASGNTLSALTQLSPADLGADPEQRRIMANIMRETLEVAAALGWDLRPEVDVDHLSTRKDRMPGVRLSMMQDVASRRPMEVDALLGQTQAFARERGVPVPTIDIILPLLRGLDRSLRAA
ncbi:MAG TPA: 2-dehydropantoate 2-reductase [Burkholderiales bacterium]|nr:2-dehydropantoate 2-reductase [Burkholderiales bacterium]